MPYQKILVHVNSEHPSPAVLSCAAEVAKTNKAGVTLVDVTSDSRWPLQWLTSGVEDAIEELSHTKRNDLRTLADDLSAQGLKVDTKVLRGRSSVEVTRAVMRDGYDLVITQAKGRNSRREGLLGTTATRLLRKCPCPVLLVHPDQDWRNRSIVAAVTPVNLDKAHEKLDHQILSYAAAICPESQPKPEIVAAWDMYVEAALKNHMQAKEFEVLRARIRSETEHHLDDLLIEHGMGIGSPSVHFLQGDPAIVIPEHLKSKDNAVLVIGTVARAGITGLLLGNTAEQLLSRVSCSILALKPAGFVSPIRLPSASESATKS